MSAALSSPTLTRSPFLEHLLANAEPSAVLDALRENGLPGKHHEEYKHTRLAEMLDRAPGFQLRAPEGQLPHVDFALHEAYTVVFLDGQFHPGHSSPELAYAGISVQPRVVTSPEDTEDGFRNLHHALCTQEVRIEIGDGIRLSKPVILTHLTSSAQAVAGFVHVTVHLGKGAELTLIEIEGSNSPTEQYTSISRDIQVGPQAKFEHYQIQNSPERFQYNDTHIHLKAESRVNSFVFTLAGKVIRNNLRLNLDGSGIESHMYGLYLLKDRTLADNHTVVDHLQPNSVSNELYKGIMDGHSRGVFNGKIYVRPHAQKTNAYQTNRNIVLTDSAEVHTKPQLEIWADDVRCSHGCTTGQLDEEGLFYLRSRGIDEKTAQAMMLYAFVGEVLESIPHSEVKNYLESLVQTRLHHTK